VLPAVPAPAGAVVEEKFRPRLTALGERHPVTEGLAGANPPDTDATATWGSWYRRIEPADVRGQTLMAAPDATPLLVLDQEGKGRVALLLSDQIWLWSRGHEGGGPQGELLRRIAHWLMKEPELEAEALTARIADGRLRVERRTTSPAPPPTVAVTAPDGGTTRLKLSPEAPGRAVADMPAPQPGVWQASDGTRTVQAAAGAANPLEIEDLRATATRLAPLAGASGGGVQWLGDGPDPKVPALRRSEPDRAAAGNGWVGLHRRHAYVVTGIASLPLLPAWIALPLLLGLLVLAWRREGA
jgi:hypothetical protein